MPGEPWLSPLSTFKCSDTPFVPAGVLWNFQMSFSLAVLRAHGKAGGGFTASVAGLVSVWWYYEVTGLVGK